MSNIKRVEKLEEQFLKSYGNMNKDIDKELSEWLKDRPSYFPIQDDPDPMPESLSKAFWDRIHTVFKKNKLVSNLSNLLKFSSDDWKWIRR